MNLFGDGCIGGSLVGLSYMMYQNESITTRLVYPSSIEIMKKNNREKAACSNFMDVISGRPPSLPPSPRRRRPRPYMWIL